MERLYKFEGFDGYRVTRSGKIYSNHSKSFLKPSISSRGYYLVALWNGRRTPHTKKIHRIVCKTFHPNPFNKPQVNHKNGNKLDNRSRNLEWNTSKENQLHSIRIGTHSCFNRNNIIDTETGNIYCSIADASRKTKIRASRLYYQLSNSKRNNTTFKFYQP